MTWDNQYEDCVRSASVLPNFTLIKFADLLTYKTYFYTAVWISVNVNLWYDHHLSWPNVAMCIIALLRFVRLMPIVPEIHNGVSVTWSLGANTQLTYKDSKHVVWVRLLPIVPILHVDASMAKPLGTTGETTYISCFKLTHS